MREKDFEDAVRFHGHACPGLAFGFRAAEVGMAELGCTPSRDEELIAICENRSCAVDAIQVLSGCTMGKGNLLFEEYGKQVYTFVRRATGEAVRLAVVWQGLAEDENGAAVWKKFSAGDRSPEVLRHIRNRKAQKIQAIRQAAPEELFAISRLTLQVPPAAVVYPSLRCDACGEKVMEPMARREGGRVLCIPCAQKGTGA